jgi:hypothetical protein
VIFTVLRICPIQLPAAVSVLKASRKPGPAHTPPPRTHTAPGWALSHGTPGVGLTFVFPLPTDRLLAQLSASVVFFHWACVQSPPGNSGKGSSSGGRRGALWDRPTVRSGEASGNTKLPGRNCLGLSSYQPATCNSSLQCHHCCRRGASTKSFEIPEPFKYAANASLDPGSPETPSEAYRQLCRLIYTVGEVQSQAHPQAKSSLPSECLQPVS